MKWAMLAEDRWQQGVEVGESRQAQCEWLLCLWELHLSPNDPEVCGKPGYTSCCLHVVVFIHLFTPRAGAGSIRWHGLLCLGSSAILNETLDSMMVD